MYQAGELIVYANTGVCRVEDVGVPAGLPSSDGATLYYKLVPLYGVGTIQIPVNTRVFMRPVLTKKQAEQLVESIPQIEEDPCTIENPRLAAEHFRSRLDTHRCEDLVCLIKTVHRRSQTQQKRGRKPSRAEQQLLRRAQELLHGELAVALELPIGEVPEYIRRRLEAS